jgi:hypothetical protein
MAGFEVITAKRGIVGGMMYVLAALVLLLNLAVAIILVPGYLRTRDVGFIWLGVAVVIWPLVSRMLEAGEHVLVGRVRSAAGEMFPFSLVASGQITLGV